MTNCLPACLQVTRPYLRSQFNPDKAVLARWAVKFLGMLHAMAEHAEQQVVVLSQVQVIAITFTIRAFAFKQLTGKLINKLGRTCVIMWTTKVTQRACRMSSSSMHTEHPVQSGSPLHDITVHLRHNDQCFAVVDSMSSLFSCSAMC